MALANDHYYGYVHEYLIKEKVTWLECAACCTNNRMGILWRDVLGHAQGRTKIRRKETTQNAFGVPHTEETLAMLVSVKPVGGDVDLAVHLEGLTMRAHVLDGLVAILRKTGYPGYEENGMNSEAKVREKVAELYREKTGEAKFIPESIKSAVETESAKVTSLFLQTKQQYLQKGIKT
eukprot:12420082-Karenia_brevis.AAC.1